MSGCQVYQGDKMSNQPLLMSCILRMYFYFFLEKAFNSATTASENAQVCYAVATSLYLHQLMRYVFRPRFLVPPFL